MWATCKRKKYGQHFSRHVKILIENVTASANKLLCFLKAFKIKLMSMKFIIIVVTASEMTINEKQNATLCRLHAKKTWPALFRTYKNSHQRFLF